MRGEFNFINFIKDNSDVCEKIENSKLLYNNIYHHILDFYTVFIL